HFLRDAGIARAIVDLVAPTAADLVIEIGPGEGALTGELARRAGRVVALEVDRGLVERLRARFPSVEVVEADARAWEYGGIARRPRWSRESSTCAFAPRRASRWRTRAASARSSRRRSGSAGRRSPTPWPEGSACPLRSSGGRPQPLGSIRAGGRKP